MLLTILIMTDMESNKVVSELLSKKHGRDIYLESYKLGIKLKLDRNIDISHLEEQIQDVIENGIKVGSDVHTFDTIQERDPRKRTSNSVKKLTIYKLKGKSKEHIESLTTEEFILLFKEINDNTELTKLLNLGFEKEFVPSVLKQFTHKGYVTQKQLASMKRTIHNVLSFL